MKHAQLDIQLRPTQVADLEKLFLFQLDEEACFLAAFTPKDPSDKSAYIVKYTKLLSDPTVNNQTIIVNDIVVGSIAKFEIMGEAEITYWIDRAYWGQRIGTKALAKFLGIEKARPIIARVAFDHYASQKVLERSGFIKIGSDKGFANGRRQETEEHIYKLS